MLHEKAGDRGTRNRGRYQVAQSWLNRLCTKDSKIAQPSSLGDSSWDRRSPAGQRGLLRTPHILVSLAARETNPVRI